MNKKNRKIFGFEVAKILGFEAAFAIIGSFIITFGIVHDFALNASWKNNELAKYGEFGKGVWLAEAKTDVTHDVIYIIGSTRAKRNMSVNVVAYYKNLIIVPSLIKYNKGQEWALPHELAHHFFYTKMNAVERENWCSTFNWTKWSDGGCSEGFAEFFGTQVIRYAPLVEIEEYNLTDGITKWREKE